MEIADTTVISNFALINRMDVLVTTIKLYTTEEVVEELKICMQKGIFKID
jgi:predicted nucleic acid-binding protein